MNIISSILFLVLLCLAPCFADGTGIDIPGPVSDFHGFVCHQLTVDNCNAYVVEPKTPLAGAPWIWRTMFWDAFSNVDVALLAQGYYVAFIDVGDTFGCPDAMKHFDVFYQQMTSQYGLSKKTVLVGLSRGGLYAFRWAYVNADKISCIYADAPVCDMKSWPGAKGKSLGDAGEWQTAIRCYHFTSEQQMMDFKGNPIDILAPIAHARIPIIDVCGDSDSLVPASENSMIVRDRYTKMRGPIVLIVKQGCDHHPHGLTDPTMIVDFIRAHSLQAPAPDDIAKAALKPGTVLELPQGKW
jgi:pimeloyl-ACP methyl ester carboxylesterase